MAVLFLEDGSNNLPCGSSPGSPYSDGVLQEEG